MTQPFPVPVHEGEIVAGKYRVERVIGVGSMGMVVAALHVQLDQRVAIKFVHGAAFPRDEGVQRLLKEARAVARLRSDHVAKVLDVGMLESGVAYLVMELLEGTDLAAWLAEHGPLPVELAADWLVQVCEAIAEAHSVGIVHRDLKPQNIFLARGVGDTTRIKVLDFGISKSLEATGGSLEPLTAPLAILGSPLYMAPEQLRSSRGVDARADVWALGVVLFELLTGRWPFEAENFLALTSKVLNHAPLSLAELRPDVPASMIGVVRTCLSKDREKRYANAGELAAALEPMVPSRLRGAVERARASFASSSTARLPVASRPVPSVEPRERVEAPERRWSLAGSTRRGRPPRISRSVGRSVGRSIAMWIGGGLLATTLAAAALLTTRDRSAAVALVAPPSLVEFVPSRVTTSAHTSEAAPAPSHPATASALPVLAPLPQEPPSVPRAPVSTGDGEDNLEWRSEASTASSSLPAPAPSPPSPSRVPPDGPEDSPAEGEDDIPALR